METEESEEEEEETLGPMETDTTQKKIVEPNFLKTGNGLSRMFRCHNGPVRTVAFRNENNVLFSCGDDKSIIKWDISTNQKTNVIRDAHNVSLNHQKKPRF